MPITTFQLVDPSEIDVSNKWNLHPYLSPEPSASLRESIQVVGLLHPLILQKISPPHSGYTLICGRFRLQATQSIPSPLQHVPALILDNTCPPEELFHLILKEQQLASPLCLMEQAYFFNLCLNHFTLDKVAEGFLPFLHKKPQTHIIKKLFPLLGLPPSIQKSIHFGFISDKTAFELLALDGEDRETLHEIIKEFGLGAGKQKRLVTLTKELAARKQLTISTLLAEEEYNNILDHPEMNTPQKMALLFSHLHNNLFPESIQAEKNFQKEVAGLNLPADFSVSHSESFEKDEVSLKITFPNMAELKRNLDSVTHILQRKKK